MPATAVFRGLCSGVRAWSSVLEVGAGIASLKEADAVCFVFLGGILFVPFVLYSQSPKYCPVVACNMVVQYGLVDTIHFEALQK